MFPMADLITAEDIAKLMEAFSKFDEDNDGLINTPELRQVLHSMGQNPTDADLQDLAYAMDTDESGMNPTDQNPDWNAGGSRKFS